MEKDGRKGVVGNLHSTYKRPGGRARLGASEGLKNQWPEEAGKMLRAQCLQSPGCGEDGTLSWGSREPWQDCWRRGHEQTSGAESSLASGATLQLCWGWAGEEQLWEGQAGSATVAFYLEIS